jgi:hypothetical protein
MFLRWATFIVLLSFSGLSMGDDPPAKKKESDAGKTKSESKEAAKADELKKYDDVITKDAKTYPGVFAVHRIKDKVYFEIPSSALGKLMLWQAEVAKGPPGVTWGGDTITINVVRWERRDNKIYLWQPSFAKRAEGKNIQHAVNSANQDAVIGHFNVECEGKDRSAVIQATSLFTTNLADLSVKGAVGGGGDIDADRSWIEEIKAFPTNIEVRSLLTFRGGGGSTRPSPNPKSFTALVHYSMVLLPEKPMQGRYFDPRVGYFTQSYEDYSASNMWTQKKQYITRYRLEKKDPSAASSEVVTPITFYLSPEIPELWRPYLKKGVEDWKPAFEKAGFKNAIVCKDPPSRAEDPSWDPEDARFSVIRWVAEPVANAMGPHVHDPRSGEVISAHVIFWNDILKITQQWYFVQCSAQDPRARKLPLPDEVTGELMRYVAAHEVGHTLGLRHNHRASSAYSIEELRSPEFTSKHGTVASIMAYGRFNYVCQPDDKIKQFVPLVGPYDIFAIDWGYKPIPTAKNSDEEKPVLDKWAAKQVDHPWLRFGGEDGPATVDPTVKTENIGNDTIKATELGLKNVDRVLEYLVAGTTKTGEDYTLLQDVYKAIMTHRRNWFNAVAKDVGGVVEHRTLGGRAAESFVRIPKKQQKEAVDFLIANAFTTPTKLLQPGIINRFKYTGVAGDITSDQTSLMRNLLAPDRIRRLIDAEIMTPNDVYSALEMVSDLQNGIWSELAGANPPKIDALRRVLQRAYLDHMKSQIVSSTATSGPVIPFPFDLGSSAEGGNSDYRAVARTAITELQKKIEAAIPKTTDGMTKAHLLDSSKEIEAMLAVTKK